MELKLVYEAPCQEQCFEKCFESFKKGLKLFSNVSFLGEGYKHNLKAHPNIKSYNDIIKLFGGNIDLLICDFLFRNYTGNAPNRNCFNFGGLENVHCKKAIIISDHWYLRRRYGRTGIKIEANEFIKFVEYYQIDYILHFFYECRDLFKGTKIENRFIFCPASVDPYYFRNYNMEKEYDVGFFGSKVLSPSKRYADRYSLHQKILKMGLKYTYNKGVQPYSNGVDHPFYGQNFSKKMNACKICINAPGVDFLGQCNAKYFYIMASRSLLMAIKPRYAKKYGLVDGRTYVEINENNVVDKIAYYLEHDDERNVIIRNAYDYIMRNHTYMIRAKEFIELLYSRMAIS